MKKFTLLATVVTIAAACAYAAAQSGDAAQPPLAIEFNVQPSFREPGKTRASIVLVNEGDEPITVMSQHMDRSSEGDEPQVLTLSLSDDMTVSWQGHKLVSSRYAFLPVTLRPGEATINKLDDGPIGLKDLDESVKSVQVAYEVSPSYGQRYGIWSGRAESDVFAVKDGNIQAK